MKKRIVMLLFLLGALFGKLGLRRAGQACIRKAMFMVMPPPPSVPVACSTCGQPCPSVAELMVHLAREHPAR